MHWVRWGGGCPPHNFSKKGGGWRNICKNSYLVVNSSSHTRFNISGLLKIQTLLKVRQGQYKNFLLQWLFYIELWGWDMAQNVNLRQKMRTEKTEKRWYFLKDDDHRWLFDNRNIGGNYWKTAETWHFVTQANFAHWLRS